MRERAGAVHPLGTKPLSAPSGLFADFRIHYAKNVFAQRRRPAIWRCPITRRARQEASSFLCGRGRWGTVTLQRSCRPWAGDLPILLDFRACRPRRFTTPSRTIQQGRLREAESIYLDLLLKQPNDVDALHYLGVLRMRQGRRDEAIDFVKRALKLAPRNADAWNNLGNMLLAGNDEKAAEFAYTSATNQKPDYAEAWYNLANLLRRQRRRDEAVNCYRRVLELNPKFAGAYENIALLFLRIGRADLTADVYRRWLAVEPDNPIARHMAAAYSDAQGADARRGRIRRENLRSFRRLPSTKRSPNCTTPPPAC